MILVGITGLLGHACDEFIQGGTGSCKFLHMVHRASVRLLQRMKDVRQTGSTLIQFGCVLQQILFRVAEDTFDSVDAALDAGGRTAALKENM